MNAFLAKYMGYIISFFCSLCGNNFAVAIFLFTLFINIVFCPINIKQQKTAANQARIKFKLEKLKEKYVYSYWARVDETHSAIRLCTSWATKDENVEALCSDIRAIKADSAK